MNFVFSLSLNRCKNKRENIWRSVEHLETTQICAKFDNFVATIVSRLSEVLNEFLTHNIYAKESAAAQATNSGHKFSICMFRQPSRDFIISFNIPLNNVLSFLQKLVYQSRRIPFKYILICVSRCSPFRINLNFFFSIIFKYVQSKNERSNHCILLSSMDMKSSKFHFSDSAWSSCTVFASAVVS